LKIDKDYGEWIESNDGTSAGTWLGPLLFIMYVKDVPVCVAPKFADDLVSVAVGDDMESVMDQLQNSADQLMSWAKCNDMELNVSKTKVMIFGDNCQNRKIMIAGAEIEKVSCYKYLGVILDTCLDFGIQVENAVGKAKRASAKVFSLIDGRRGIPVHIGINLHKMLVRPHLEYALPVWASISDQNLRKLEDAQSQCLRRVIGSKAHSSVAAIEVISGVCPMGVRRREICCREYLRIVSKGQSSIGAVI